MAFIKLGLLFPYRVKAGRLTVNFLSHILNETNQFFKILND